MKSSFFIKISGRFIVFLLLAIPCLGYADISNIDQVDTVSDTRYCVGWQSTDQLAGYQYLGQGLTGTLSQVDIKLLNPPPVVYGKAGSLDIYESDAYLDNLYDITTQGRLVWQRGDSVADAIGVGEADAIFPFTPTIGSDYEFLPNKYYYMTPQFHAYSYGGNCQPYYLYGSTNSDSYPYGEFYSDTFVKDLYFDLHGLDRVATSTQPSGNSNVLFIPGLEASRLYETKTILGIPTEDQLWEPNTSSDGAALYMNTYGSSINTGIYTRDIIKESNTPIPTGPLGQNIYKSFASMMDGLVSSNKMNAWKAFPYDWRYGVQEIVDDGTVTDNGKVTLTSTLQDLADSSADGKVTIIAHSNGGLITKAFLKKLEDDKTAGNNNLIDKIDKIILVASPQLGTPSAVPAILHGYDQDINPFFVYALLNVSTARQLAQNMPGAYGLLPSTEYFNRVNNPVVSFVPNIFDPYISNEISAYGQTIATYSTQKDFMLGTSDNRTNPPETDTLKPIKAVSDLLTNAETLHSSIDTMIIPANIKVIQIAGWGIDTISGFQYDTDSVCPLPTSPGCVGNYMLDEVPVFTSDGDKTVVTPSALAMDAEKWWFNLKTYNVQSSINKMHGNILEAEPILNFISETVQNTNIQNSLYLSTIAPTDSSNRLRLSVHSPVTLDAYDSQGNHTGKICPTNDSCNIEENILNSSYYEFGEGKYINLPQETLQKVNLQGIDVGTFTFDTQVVFPNGQATTTSFTDIPVTTQTQAEITINQTTGVPLLKLDVTGDGIADFTLSPSTEFDPIVYLQIMKATIDSLDIPNARKKAFDNRVENIIKLIQKGKIDKAKLRTDKFKIRLENKIAKPDSKHPRPKQMSKTDAQMLLDMLNQLLDNIG